MTPISARSISRRDFIRLFGIGTGATILSGGALIGCGRSGSGNELLVWYWGEQEAQGMKQFMERAAKSYAEKNDTPVKTVLQESDTLYTAFRTAAKSGSGPDVQFFWGGTQALEDVWMGNVAPLSDNVPKSWLENIPRQSRRETFWNGKQWGLPFYQIGTAWAYNKKLFAKAGLDPENPPETWPDFLAALEKLKALDVAPIGSGFKDGYLGGWLISYMGDQNLDSIDEAIAVFRGDAEYSGDKYTEWVFRLKELIDGGFLNSDILSIDLYQGQDLFATEKAAITNSIQPQMVNWERSMGSDTVGVMLTPSFGSGTLANKASTPSQVLTITSFADQKEDAASFLEYLHTPEVMKRMYEQSGAVAPDKRFQKDWLNANIDLQFAEWASERPNFWYQYYYPFPFERAGVTPATQMLFEANGTPQEAIGMMQGAIKDWREQHPEQVKAYNNWHLLD